MELITILNRCHRFRGFVYQHARFNNDKKSIEVAVRPRNGSTAICSRCHQPARGYDQLAERRFEFIPLWEFPIFLLYTMRRVDCRRCDAVVVEEVLWGDGKRTLTKAYMCSWHAGRGSFRGRKRPRRFTLPGTRSLTQWNTSSPGAWHTGSWSRSMPSVLTRPSTHKYLTLVYQIDLDNTRLLWVGKERTIESFQEFFAAIGQEVTSKIAFFCSDMWEPSLKVIREKCSEVLHILDRAGETRRMRLQGLHPVLRNSRWLLLRREETLNDEQRFRLRDILRYNLKTVRAYLLKEIFQQLWDYQSAGWASSWTIGAATLCGPTSSR